MFHQGDVECWFAGTWGRSPALHRPREGPGVIDHAGRLYVIGGRGGEGTVEVFDPELQTWEILDQRLLSQDQEYTAVILDRVV